MRANFAHEFAQNFPSRLIANEIGCFESNRIRPDT